MNNPPLYCPHCGKTHPPGIQFCPVTGYAMPVEMRAAVPARAGGRSPVRKNWLWGGVLLLGIGLLLALGFWLLPRISLPSFRDNENVAISEQVALTNTPSPTRTSAPTEPQPFSPTPPSTLLPLSSSTPLATEPPASTDTPPPSPTFTLTPLPLALTGELAGKIAFTCQIFKNAERNQICLIHADGSGWQRLTQNDAVDHNYPSFAPDGKSIFYSSNPMGSYDIFEITLEGVVRQITDLPGNEYAPTLSPDGQRLVFTYHDGLHQAIWLTDRTGNTLQPITYGSEREAWDPTWSPDGTQILFASGSVGNVQLFVMNADGTHIRQVTQLPDLRGRSSWSPDGLTLATYQGGTWLREIILFDLNGENLLQLADGGNNLAPSFSPYGGWLAFTSYQDHYRDDHGCEIYLTRLDTGETLRLTDNDYCDWQPSWGP